MDWIRAFAAWPTWLQGLLYLALIGGGTWFVWRLIRRTSDVGPPED